MPAATSIGTFDTALKIGLGALAAVAGTLAAAAGAFGLEVYRRRQERVREREQRYRENLEGPVVSFVDEALRLIARAYWNKPADGKDSGVGTNRVHR